MLRVPTYLAYVAIFGSTPLAVAARPTSRLVSACPLSIAAGQIGKTPFARGKVVPLVLTGVTFFDGPPDERVILAPTIDTKRGGFNLSAWRHLATNSAGTWLVCEYGDTAPQIRRQLLDRRVKICELLFTKPRPDRLRVKSLICTQ